MKLYMCYQKINNVEIILTGESKFTPICNKNAVKTQVRPFQIKGHASEIELILLKLKESKSASQHSVL